MPQYGNPIWTVLRRSLVCVSLALMPLLAFAQDDEYIGPETGYEPEFSAGKGYRPGSASWEYCATENDHCSVQGRAVVRYGTDGRYVYREVRNASFRCDNRRFGDPAPRRKKQCEVRYLGGGNFDGGRGRDHGRDDRYEDHDEDYGSGWEYCADEGDYCDFRGRRTVRYGVDGRYVVEEFRGGTDCTNEAFGRDPAPRKGKSCEVEAR